MISAGAESSIDERSAGPLIFFEQVSVMKSVLAILIAGVCVLTLSACNTLQGAGRDLQRAGEGLEEAVD